MRLAARIRRARLRAKISQKVLAAHLGISRGAVANWESANGVIPATERLLGIAHATGANLEWLATGRGAATHQPSLDDIAATYMEMIEDPLELRLLRAFRSTPQRQHKQIVEQFEARGVTAQNGFASTR